MTRRTYEEVMAEVTQAQIEANIARAMKKFPPVSADPAFRAEIDKIVRQVIDETRSTS